MKEKFDRYQHIRATKNKNRASSCKVKCRLLCAFFEIKCHLVFLPTKSRTSFSTCKPSCTPSSDTTYTTKFFSSLIPSSSPSPRLYFYPHPYPHFYPRTHPPPNQSEICTGQRLFCLI